MQICMTFNTTADSLARHGHARRVDRVEGMELLHQAHESNLVQFGENVREKVAFICNCCGCCCEAMIAARRFAMLHPVHTTNFLPSVNAAECSGCGKCVSACPVEAMSLVSANEAHRPKAKKARLNEDVCLGCGVCVRACTHGRIRLVPRARRVITPVNGAHRAVVMAIERGKLQHLLFDDRALASHRAMAAILSVILRLPPIQQRLANRQLRSRYVERLLASAAQRDRRRPTPASPAAPPPMTLH
jgi:Na+-translocating ferredoxin:NAD+ oxidoreductase RNF subunit RnfB